MNNFTLSFWTKPIFHELQDYENSRLKGGWVDYRTLLLGSAFNCFSLRRQATRLSLVTDSKGLELLGETLKLPYDAIYVDLDRIIDIDHRIWVSGKLAAIKMQDKPFLHIDNDVFLWEPLPTSSRSDYLLAQSRIRIPQPYKKTLQQVFECFKEATIHEAFTLGRPRRIIGDRAYDADPLDERLKEQRIELIAPHRGGRIKTPTQDGRPLRRYKRRWKIERLFAWMNKYKRIYTRWDKSIDHYNNFIYLTFILILSRYL